SRTWSAPTSSGGTSSSAPSSSSSSSSCPRGSCRARAGSGAGRSRRGGRGLSRWSDRAAGGERRGAQALEIDRGHVEAQRAQDGVGELAVAAEVPANPPAPRGDAPVGVKLEGRLATVQRGADVVGGQLEQGRALERRVAAAFERLREPGAHLR